MKFPTLKNTLLCKLIIYSVIILPFIATIIIVPTLLFIPEAIRLLFLLVFCIAVIIYVTKSYVLLMMMVATLDVINCRNTARKQFVLPNSFSMKSVEDKISGFGKEVQAVSVNPTPQTLRYKSCYSLSAYSKGVEKVIATYYSELLNKEEYVKIVNSAKANAKAIMKKSPRNKAPYSRVTVVVIFAKHLSEEFKEDLFTTVCKTGTIGVEVSVLPCVVVLV